MGESIRRHREGQPQEIYGEGQEMIVGLLQDVQRSELERVLTETGDLDALTALLNGDASQEVTEEMQGALSI